MRRPRPKTVSDILRDGASQIEFRMSLIGTTWGDIRIRVPRRVWNEVIEVTDELRDLANELEKS